MKVSYHFTIVVISSFLGKYMNKQFESFNDRLYFSFYIILIQTKPGRFSPCMYKILHLHTILLASRVTQFRLNIFLYVVQYQSKMT
jgi:hypothetical protein